MQKNTEEHNKKVHKNITKYQYLSTFSRRACTKLTEALRRAKERNHECN